MELEALLGRFAEGIPAVDAGTAYQGQNRRTGEDYLPGVKTMTERAFVAELLDWWRASHGADFVPRGASAREIPYPHLARATCDLILSTDGSPLVNPEWSIEVKHIALVGNNGKNNDYGVPKLLSPYLKDRSLIHDIYRLRDHGVGRRRAVIGYCFGYSFVTCDEALRRHPGSADVVANLRAVCRSTDPINGDYSVLPMVEFADEIFRMKGLVHPFVVTPFRDAWRHPCGGSGHVFGWELLRG